MNTRFTYLYRDACNYKQVNDVVVPGVFTQAQIDSIIGCLDSGWYFIPAQIGFLEIRFGEITEDDHCWFELERDGITETDADADFDITPNEVVAAFMQAKGNWDETMWLRNAGCGEPIGLLAEL